MADSPLTKWRHAVPEVPTTDPNWQYVEIPLGLDRAVTMTATIVATLEFGPHSVSGQYGSTAHHRHEAVLGWQIEDTLDEESWHIVASGQLRTDLPQQVARVSAALGTAMRLGVYPFVLITKRVPDGGSILESRRCDHCGIVDHATLPVTDLVFNIAVRSI